MAKKRGDKSPLGNTFGSRKAEQHANESNLDTLVTKVSLELKKSGKDVTSFLTDHFGLESVSKSVEWTLLSGEKVLFNEISLSYEQVRDNTFVTFDVNGRDQSLLTKESLEDLSSLAFQQFYPAVGYQADGKIDVLDGSRRRAWFLLQKGTIKHFKVLVTNGEISIADAKSLAKQLQTAKEHNQREIGLQCKTLMENGEFTQSDISQIIGISRQAVGRSLKAASIDERIINLFPIVNELSHTDYSTLKKVMLKFEGNRNDLVGFVHKIKGKIVNDQPKHCQESLKHLIINLIKSELKLSESLEKTKKIEVTTLVEFSSKGMFARKRVKDRNFSYEFGRLSKEIQQELDEVIMMVLNKE